MTIQEHRGPGYDIDPDPGPDPETDPRNVIPDPPENLQADTITHDTMVISWGPVSNATAYKVVYGEYSYGNNETEEEFVPNGETFGLTLLSSLTTYKIEVYSINWAGYSWWPSTIYVQTDEAYGQVWFSGCRHR